MCKLILLTLFFLSGTFRTEQKQKVLLAVLAHPDDEGAIAQLLTKYSKDNKVYIIIATDGRNGTKPGFPTGDTLVKLRQAESECACKQMGTQPPIFLGFTDGFDTRDGVGIYLDQSKKLKELLSQKIKEINPDFIITFGPDGDTGHSDHRMISNMTTEVILKEGWAERYPLYYIAWTKKDDEKFKMIGGLNTVHPSYINVAITYSDEDERKGLQAIRCYKSQLSEKEMDEWVDVEKKDTTNVFHFRKLMVSTIRKKDF
jgi:N-acetylglucosamine malate deacetylase 2